MTIDKINVLFYMDDSSFSSKIDNGDSTNYALHEFLEDSRFNTNYSFEPDASLASDYDVIFCRFNIPVKSDFLMQLDELYSNSDKLFINPPNGKLKYHTKHYLKEFVGSDILPPTCISDDYRVLSDFAKSYDGNLIVKPLNLNKGNGIYKLDSKGKSLSELEEIALRDSLSNSREMIYQGFIENIETIGDKRINSIFYKPINGILRLPKDGSYICNYSAGGSINPTFIEDSDRHIFDIITPFLEKNKLSWCGVDVMGKYLGEINVASPGLFYACDKLYKNKSGISALKEGVLNHFK